MKKYNNFLFKQKSTGEYFYVQEDDFQKAKAIAMENFPNDCKFLGIADDDEQAEISGYDTY